ncbi:MAG: CopY family transcriptional regulator [Acidobacteria bacterium]|nr:MAG: CopY family transcriptional regulator [Acidobacteriota bacterium]
MTLPHLHLSRRERQIMDVLYRKGSATAAEVLENIPQPPSYSAVRALLRILEQKGHIKHEESEGKYVFMPTVPADKAKRSAMRHVVQTFFGGSAEQAVAALLDASSAKLSDSELDRLQELIERARKGDKK